MLLSHLTKRVDSLASSNTQSLIKFFNYPKNIPLQLACLNQDLNKGHTSIIHLTVTSLKSLLIWRNTPSAFFSAIITFWGYQLSCYVEL